MRSNFRRALSCADYSACHEDFGGDIGHLLVLLKSFTRKNVFAAARDKTVVFSDVNYNEPITIRTIDIFLNTSRM